MIVYDDDGEPVGPELGILDGFKFGSQLDRYLWWSARSTYRFTSDVQRDMVEAHLNNGDGRGALALLDDWERAGTAYRLGPPKG